ncbi:molecular chaperone HscB [Geosmithia morbida]|uniref:Molecular chaperone HscB n=1 Tax=Geosmithia morbida TaxID=1094350 RepID=A0A9P4YYJ4_9HYPO|nr:molecular chaperone HscB [Geosmithia morbida]KAF4123359.1 molecular chaperone HscB [Geosmithia morbida]
MRPSTIPPIRASFTRVCTRCRLQGRGTAAAAPGRSLTASSWRPQHPTPSILTKASYTTTTARLRSNRSSSSGSNDDEIPFVSALPKTHYDMFPSTLPDGPPPTGHFPIDTRSLRREFLRLQARAHPDLQPASSKPAAEASSALINEAYRTLADPLLRAQYLLSLRGVDVANDETLKIEEPDLLMTVLEAREEIEEAESEEELERPRSENDERIRQSEEVLDEAFAADDIDAAKREAVRLRYWVNIKQSLDNWEKGVPIVLQH